MIEELTRSVQREGCFKWNMQSRPSRYTLKGFVGDICCVSYLSAETTLVIQLGSTAIGVKTKEGVVLAVEKRVTSVLLVSWF